MVVADDLSKAMESQQDCAQARGSLLRKFDIPLHYLDFAYINECTDGNRLEKILQILKSGEEGYYPELTMHTMKRLETIKPNSKFLKVFTPVLTKHTIDRENFHDISNDLHSWVSDINKNDTELQLMKSKSLAEVNMPKVRNVTESKSSTVIKPLKRIASTDYTSWDKYDPETEMLKMDLDEQRIKRESNKIENTTKNEKNERKIQSSDFANKTELKFEANREKEKGNEYFKAGEYNQALEHYTKAIEYCPDAIMYTNRAIAYIKLNKHKKAIEDCDKALKYDPYNIKAFLRMAKSQQALGKYKKALYYAERAIEIEPNNLVAQITTEKLRKLSGENLRGNVRIEITDVSDKIQDQKETTCKSILKKEQYKIIPIPGTSRMKEPYYHNVHLSDKRSKGNDVNKCTWHPFRSVNAEESSDEECLEIHLKNGVTYHKNEDAEMAPHLNLHRMELKQDGVNNVNSGGTNTYNNVKEIEKSTYETIRDEGIIENDKNVKEMTAAWAALAEITDDANERDINIKENATDVVRLLIHPRTCFMIFSY